MHHFFVVVLLVLLTGCANAVRMCGLEAQTEWQQLHFAPTNEGELVALLKGKEPSGVHRYWFARKGGALLLCRQDPTFATNRCNSDGWLFTKAGNIWRVENSWAEACTG